MNKLVEAVLAGVSPATVLDEAQVGIPHKDGMRIRTFFDSYGDLRFCTEDDVLIDHSSCKQMLWLREVSNDLEADSQLVDLLSDFVGTLDDLFSLNPDLSSGVTAVIP